MPDATRAIVLVIFSAVIASCQNDNTYVTKKDGQVQSHVCDYGQGIKETVVFSDCSLQFEQYARDYTFAVDVLGKAKVTLGAPPKELIDLSENAQQLIIAHASLCRDRNACIYPRKEYVEIKKQYDFAFAKLKEAAKDLDTKVKAVEPAGKPPVLGPGDEMKTYASPEVNEFNNLAKSILKRTGP
jgi:hypothetical protein